MAAVSGWLRLRSCHLAASIVRGVSAYRLEGVVRAVVFGVVVGSFGVFFGVFFVRIFGVVRAFVLGASGIVTGIVNPQVLGLLYSGNGSIWSGAGQARCCLFFGLVSLAE